MFDPGASPVQQTALGRFLADGLLDRHVARVRRALLDRQNAAILARSSASWAGSWTRARRAAGRGSWPRSRIRPGPATEVVRIAAEAGIAIESLAPSRVTSAPDRELIVDYGRLEPLELRAAFRVLGKALRSSGRARPALIAGFPSLAARA